MLVLFAFMPALDFVGLWYSYLSASPYSGSTEEGYAYAERTFWTMSEGKFFGTCAATCTRSYYILSYICREVLCGERDDFW